MRSAMLLIMSADFEAESVSTGIRPSRMVARRSLNDGRGLPAICSLKGAFERAVMVEPCVHFRSKMSLVVYRKYVDDI